jgi:predicted exporter
VPADGNLKARRLRATLWLLAVITVVAATVVAWPGPGWLRTDVRALLPEPGGGPRVAEASRSLAAPFEQRTVWLIGASGGERAARAGRELAERFRATDVFEEVEAEVDRAAFERVARALYPYRHGLIARDTAQRLDQAPAAFLRERLALQYSVAGAAGGSLTDDPLGLYNGFLQEAVAGPARAAITIDNVPIVEGRGRHYAIVTADTRAAGFEARAEPPLIGVWRDTLAWAEDESLTLHATGAPLYSAWAAQSAHGEISLIGGVSLAAIALLLIGRFRSPRPLAIAVIVIGAGVGGGFAGTVLAFGGMHLITLIFGATVIGVSVDYAFHYFSDSLRPGWTPEAGLRHVLPALRLALGTSAIAFLSLALAPFPALREVAVFTVCGLVASWSTVVLLLPMLVRPPASAPPPRHWSPGFAPRLVFVIPAVLVLSLPGILLLEPKDDIRLLYATPERLSADDDAIGELLPRPDANRFLLVSADSGQALLEREERLRPELERLVDSGALDGFRGVTDWLPSLQRQRDNERLLQGLVDSGRFSEYLRDLGFGEAGVERREAAIREPGPYLGRAAALDVALERQRAQWLGCNDDDCAAAIVVTGAGEGAALERLAAEQDGVRWVNRIAAVNEGMHEHRRLSLGLLALALLIMAAVLSLTLGLARGMRVVAVPALALVVSLAAVGYSGALFSVFNLMALLLVLGVGIDYALFYHCAPSAGRPTAALGIGMAALTTILAFGLLVFSDTPVISAFGMTLLPGLTAAWLLALVTGSEAWRE